MKGRLLINLTSLKGIVVECSLTDRSRLVSHDKVGERMSGLLFSKDRSRLEVLGGVAEAPQAGIYAIRRYPLMYAEVGLWSPEMKQRQYGMPLRRAAAVHSNQHTVM